MSATRMAVSSKIFFHKPDSINRLTVRLKESVLSAFVLAVCLKAILRSRCALGILKSKFTADPVISM